MKLNQIRYIQTDKQVRRPLPNKFFGWLGALYAIVTMFSIIYTILTFQPIWIIAAVIIALIACGGLIWKLV